MRLCCVRDDFLSRSDIGLRDCFSPADGLYDVQHGTRRGNLTGGLLPSLSPAHGIPSRGRGYSETQCDFPERVTLAVHFQRLRVIYFLWMSPLPYNACAIQSIESGGPRAAQRARNLRY